MAKLNRMMGSPLAAVMAAASAPAPVAADADANAGAGGAASAASSVVGAVVTPLFEKPKAPGRARAARSNADDADQAQDRARAAEDALAEAQAKAALDIAEREASSAAEAASLAATASISPHALVAEKSAAKKSGAEKSGAKVSGGGRKSVMGAKHNAAKDVWAMDFETVFHGGRVAVQDAERAFFALKRDWRYHYAVLLGNSLMLFTHTCALLERFFHILMEGVECLPAPHICLLITHMF